MLSPRLQKIFDRIDPGSSVADIGTDHGYLAKALLDAGKSSFVIAADINEQPLARAKTLFGSAYRDRIDFRLGSGLSVLRPEECGTIVIAGMGGYLIRDILSADPLVARSAEKLILQPMSNSAVLRLALADSGFEITEEHIVIEENRYYEIMVVRSGQMALKNEAETIIGYEKARIRTPEFDRFLDFQIRRQEKILNQLENNGSPAARQQREESKKLLEQFSEIKNVCKSSNDIQCD